MTLSKPTIRQLEEIIFCYTLQEACIVELVDSICWDIADAYYMLIQKYHPKSQKQLSYKPLEQPTIHLSSAQFIFI